MLVAIFASVTVPADATLDRMTGKEIVLTLAGLHAVVTVITLGAYLGASGTTPTWRASALAVVGPAFASVLALAVLRAIESKGTGWAGRRAIFTLPAW